MTALEHAAASCAFAAGNGSTEIERVAARYAVSLTPDMAELIDPSDPHDPIARQFVPDRGRARRASRASAPIPIGDDAHTPVEGIVHRYPDRVLLKLVHVCPVYCRFCFRREMVGPRPAASRCRAPRCDAALDYIRAHPEIWEVILTGGDPLILSPRRLREVMRALARDRARQDRARAHARAGGRRRRRIHAALVRALKVRGKATYVVLHANHPRELTARRAPPARASSMPASRC